MKQINFNDFKKMGIELIIDDKTFNVQFIPYPVESDIYRNLKNLNDLFSDITKITVEWEEKIKNWIWITLSHKKNNNIGLTQDIWNDIGLTDVITIMILLINYITDRMKNMNSMGSDDKKKIEAINPAPAEISNSPILN